MIICLNCGNEYNATNKNQKFCCKSCANSYNNKLRPKKIKKCQNCNKILASRQNKFCSNKCQNEYYYKSYIERWKNDEENGLRGKYSISEHIRHYLMEKHNNSCQLCGWNKKNIYTNNIPLEIHHIDGDYSNNKEENLQLLCPNCHSLTDTFKNHNKKGRKDRIK